MDDNMSDRFVPSQETVDFYRTVLEEALQWLDGFAADRLSGDERAGFEKALRLLRYRTLGSESGCVVTAFDRRWPKLYAVEKP